MSRRRLGLFKKGGAPSFSFGNALQFDGVDDYISLANPSVAVDTYSLSCWVNSATMTTVDQSLFGNTSILTFLRLQQASNRFQLRLDGANYFSTLPISLSNNTWYYVALSVNSLVANLYINTNKVSVGTINTVTLPTRFFNQIGKDKGGSFLPAKMDEQAIWYGYALTDTDISNLSNPLTTNIRPSDISPSNLHSYYKYDESDPEIIAVDSSGNGNDGTLNNFPASGMWVAH